MLNHEELEYHPQGNRILTTTHELPSQQGQPIHHHQPSQSCSRILQGSQHQLGEPTRCAHEFVALDHQLQQQLR